MSETKAKQRMLGLDALRGIAVLLMIEQHLGVWLWVGPGKGETMTDYPGLLAFNALGGGAAPAFVTLAGIGSSLLVSKRASPDRSLILRGLVVMGFGYLLSFLTPSWFDWRNSWFVLHLMGFGMLTTPLWRRLPSSALLGVALLVLAATGPMQAWLDVPLELNNEYMAGRAPSSPQQWTALRLAVAEAQFPIFPWFSFYLAGLVCGRWVSEDKLDSIATLACGVLGLGLCGLILRGLIIVPKSSVLGRSVALNVPFFPASPTLVALLLAIVLTGIWAVMALERRRSMSDHNPLVTLGRASLTLLLVHVWLFREATRPIGVWQALDLISSTAVLIGFILVAIVATRLWQKLDYRFGAEWLLRKLAP
jgi:uncharacterized membrane protein